MRAIGIRSTAAVLMCLAAIQADAGQIQGAVVQVIQRASGLAYFTIDGTATDQPSCATTSHWVIPNDNADVAKRLLAIVLLAKSSRGQLIVKGANTCKAKAGGEDVAEITMVE